MMRVRRVVAGLAAASLMGAGAALAPHMAGAAPADEGDAAPKLEVSAKKLDKFDFSNVFDNPNVIRDIDWPFPDYPWIGESTVFEVTVTGCNSNVEGEDAILDIEYAADLSSGEWGGYYPQSSPNGSFVRIIVMHNKVAQVQEEAGQGILDVSCISPSTEFDGLEAHGYLPFDGKPTIDINAKGDVKDEGKAEDKQDDKADKAEDKQDDKADKAKDKKAKKGKKLALPSTGV